MSDSEDRHRADLFETELRRKTALDPGNSWELIWFLGLPLEVRCSYMRILEARIDQDTTRRRLFRQSCYRQRSWRQPALPCMFLEPIYEPSRPWASLGRRQRRKPIEYGRASNRRTRAKLTPSTAAAAATALSSSASTPPATRNRRAPARRRRVGPMSNSTSAPAPISSVDLDEVPLRPSTPAGLRDALREDTELLFQASGYSLVTLEQEPGYTPLIPVTPLPQPVYEPLPLHIPSRGFRVNGMIVPPTLAFVVATGRAHMEPWDEHEEPLADAAWDIGSYEKECPGILTSLARILFPDGFHDFSLAVPMRRVVLDFIMGWSILPQAQANCQLPMPWQRCSCGQGVVYSL